jgi:hypothetical protein
MMRGLFCILGVVYTLLLGVGIYVAVSLVTMAAKAEDLTTGNLVPPMENMTASGSTSHGAGSGCQSGAYCTSGTQGGGGTYTSTFNVPLTEAEVQKGFTLNSGVTINSHISNSNLDSCTDIMQSGDCRDIFKLTITLLDDNTTVETFTHQEELDWTGLRDFTYTDTVTENNYGILSGVFSLYGIDAGYPYGFYGPQFSDPSLTIDYQTVLIQQQVEAEIQTQIEQAAQTEAIQVAEVVAPVATTDTTSDAPPPPPPDTSVSGASAGSDTAPAAEAPAETAPPAPPSPPAAPTPPVAPTVQTETASSESETTTEEAAEAEIEAEVEASTEAASESADESSGQSSNTQTTERPTSDSQPKPPAKNSKTTKTKVRMSPAQAAQTIVSRIAPSQRYGTSAQTVTMVAMGMMSNTRGLLKSSGIPDAVKFFKAADIPDGPSLVDPLQNYILFGTSNGVHDALVESQWRN